MSKSKPRVLCVDDESMVLSALRRQLGSRFDVTVADGGRKALDLIATNESFAVISSDLRMPGMNGVEFLAEARVVSPDSVRILLTGQADLDAAIEAVNEGSIFRFLSKPCPPRTLQASIEAAVGQYELVTAQRVLLEQTLHGSIKTLTDLLGIVSPVAFGRAARVKEGVGKIAAHLGEIDDQWQIEIAAMVSQLGSVTLPNETAERMYHGVALSADEQAMVSRVPEITTQLLSNIPRLESVVDIVRSQHARFDMTDQPSTSVRRPPPMGSRIVKALTDYDVLISGGSTGSDALDAMRRRTGAYDPDVLAAMTEAYDVDAPAEHILDVFTKDLTTGMVFAEDVKNTAGVLLVARGFEVTKSVLERLRNFDVSEPLRVFASDPGAEAAAESAPPEVAASTQA